MASGALKRFFQEKGSRRLALIVVAALLLELIALVQYIYTGRQLQAGQERITRVDLKLRRYGVAQGLDKGNATAPDESGTLAWLSDTLNTGLYYPSSLCFMLSADGAMLSRPESPEKLATACYVAGLMADPLTPRGVRGHENIGRIDFRDPESGRKAYVDYKALDHPEGWTIALVSYKDEVLGPVRSMMTKISLLFLAALLVLVLIIWRFSRVENRLRQTDLERARLDGELQVARKIQGEMLPSQLPDREDVSLSGTVIPAREVGGDLYDFLIRDGKLFFCVGDVSGKGIPAAMVMAVTHGVFRMVADEADDPARIMQRLNTQACRNNETGMFVTFFVGVLDLATGWLNYCNAGHDHPVLVSEAGAVPLPAKANLPLGPFEDYTYEAQETVVPRGAVLFLYTDGVTEAKDVNRKQFGLDRLLETLSGGSRTPGEMVRSVEESVRRFTDGAEQSDDITMLSIRYDGMERMDETLTLSNDLSQVEPLTGFVQGLADRLGLADKPAKSLRLALEEAVVNVINYAYPPGTEGEVTVRSHVDGGKLLLTVTDSGKPFDPTAAPPVDISLPVEDRPVGGLGIHLVRHLMDAVRYERRDGKNVLTLEKNL